MRSHHIKIHQRYFYDVCVGKKPFEFRRTTKVHLKPLDQLEFV